MASDDASCALCGLDESCHHAFRPATPPAGCVCDPREWPMPTCIPPQCGTFAPMDGEPDLCVACEHLRGCHGN